MSEQPPHGGGYSAYLARQSVGDPGDTGLAQVPESLRSPLFFLSYAHSHNGPRKAGATSGARPEVGEFFGELSENIAELVSRRAGADPGYMDSSIPVGTRWTDELLAAIGRCQIFIPLLSARYFDSDWCGMEWYAFTRRMVLMRNGADRHHTAIIPVIWAPVADELVPAVVRSVQRFSPGPRVKPEIAQNYAANGLFGLRRRGFDADYHTIIWELALYVSDIKNLLEVKPLVLKEVDLRNIFDGQG